MNERLFQRFASKVECLDSGCCEWTASLNKDGYGNFTVDSSYINAHRFAYLYFIGPIPLGFVLDHLCRNRKCVNPDHLEAVPHLENVRRGRLTKVAGAHQRAKTHCPSGHPYSGDNLYRWKNARICRACTSSRQKVDF